MGNIIDYVREFGDKSFKERPLDEVDALVLSQFIYLKWEHIIPRLKDNSENMSISRMCSDIKERGLEGEVFMDERYRQDNMALLDAMVTSVRFGDLSCNYLYDDIDKEAETQFFAFTVFLPDTMPVIVFRGTDETLLGWKEDFNMAYRAPVPGQSHAATYIKQVALRLPGGFMTAGHSKGGNLATYSVLTAAAPLRDRVLKIYNFDGPGFNREIMERYDYPLIADRLCKIVPESSIVGVILERDDRYKTVTSSARGGAQHNPYTWLIYDGRFDYIDNVSTASRVLRDSVTGWMDEADPDKRELVFGTIYDILESSQAETTIELKGSKTASKNMLKALVELPEETREKIKEVMKDFKLQI